MAKELKPDSNRKPPTPAEGHAEVEQWIRRVMPDLHPIVTRLDEMIRAAIPGLHSAVKWKKAYYGLPDLGWIIELASYDVSVNVVFLGGADFENPPPLGTTGRTRYIKVKTLDEASSQDLRRWIEQAAGVPGWS